MSEARYEPADGHASGSTVRGVPSVAKAVRILETLAGSREPVSLADLSRRLELPKSSTRTLCTTLVATRLATRDENGSYGLGPHVVDLSRAYLARVDLAADFGRICELVPELAAHTLTLAVLDGRDVVYVARRPGAEPISAGFQVGTRLPGSCTAAGKLLLSRRSPAEIERLYPGPELPTLTQHSLTTVAGLREALAETRRRGYATDDEESATGVFAVAAPVIGADGDTAAAVGAGVAKTPHVTPPAPEHLLTLGRLLSERLGGPASPRGIAGQVRTWGRTAARAGDELPDLELAATGGRPVSLRNCGNGHRPVILFFYPGDREGLRYPELAGCTTQARAFRDAASQLTAAGASVFGVSLQSTVRQREFVTREGLPFELLSDRDRELVGALGVPLWLSLAGEDYASRVTIVARGGVIEQVIEDQPAEEQVAAALHAVGVAGAA